MLTINPFRQDITKVMILSGFLFTIISYFVYPVNYNNLGGTHSWLSAHTISTVNMWLEYGPIHENFSSFLDYNNIEFENNSRSRSLYLSYPTFTFFIVWLLAKILCFTSIDISFLKHFQNILFFIETVSISVIAYYFISSLKIRGKISTVLLPVTVSIFWATLPGNQWYLANIFFTDILIIFFVITFMLLKYLEWQGIIKQNKIINLIEGIVILCGVLTDYYFWIFIFLFFIGEIFINYGNKKLLIITTLIYCIPVSFGLILFYLQLSLNDNWLEILIKKAEFRTSYQCFKEGNAYVILKNFRNLFLDSNVYHTVILSLVYFCIFLSSSIIIFREHTILVKSNTCFIIIVLLAPLLQVSILNNHSAIHEFALVKFSIPFALLSIFIPQGFVGKKLIIGKANINLYTVTSTFFIFIYLILLKQPYLTNKFIDSRNDVPEYKIERIIKNITDYQDVVFSLTYEIDTFPPQNQSISHKRVYKVNSLDDIYSFFPLLNKKSRRIYLLDKTNSSKKTEIKTLEEHIKNNFKMLYEDNNCALYLATQFFNN